MDQFTTQIQQQLATHGYDPAQVRTIMGLARRMASGENVAVRQSWLDVNDLNRVAQTLATGQHNPRQRESLIRDMGIHGPIGRIRLREVPVRTPERTYAYRVTLGTRTYEVVSRSELPARSGTGPAGLARSRRGQLRQALVEGSPGMRVYAVTRDGTRGAELNRAQRQTFAQQYVSRYNRMERSMLQGQSPEELITISSVRRRPSSG